MSVMPSLSSVRKLSAWKLFLLTMGPGIIVMLADTDAGSVVTAAQSGAQWQYGLLLLQFLLVPVLFVIQELTVRLGIFTGKGHGELIRETFGAGWAWLSVAGLAVASLGALITEFAGVAGAGELFGVPRWISLMLAAGFLLIIVWTGSYRRVERVAIALGLFEFAFFGVAIASHPRGHAMVLGLVHMPLSDPSYLYMVAANIGAVIMPWMVFYQQSAVVDKGLTPENYRHERWDTALGSLITQLVMVSILVATATTIGRSNPNVPLNTVGQISRALAPFLGGITARVVFSLGILGAAMVAAVVVSLAAAWGAGEVTGFKHSLEHRPLEAPWFYLGYSAAVATGAVLVALIPNLVALSVAVQVMNALLLPLVLGFLVALAIRALPPEHRLRGWYRWMVIGVSLLTAGLGVYGGLSGARWW